MLGELFDAIFIHFSCIFELFQAISSSFRLDLRHRKYIVLRDIDAKASDVPS